MYTGSDAKKVYDVLLGVVRSHPMVLRNPEPMVLFTGFTDMAMTFEARGFLADINNGAVCATISALRSSMRLRKTASSSLTR